MGILDDAIREHLELKRRRGGDPSEIERLEREALGPIRRMPETEAAFEAGQSGVELEQPPHEAYDTGEPAPGPPAEELKYEAPEDPVAEEPWRAPAPEPIAHPDPVPATGDPSVPEPEVPPPGPQPEPGSETAEYDVEAEHAKSAAEGDDVLEETPEFLQETPDHDRLWFEQRPPRDFDFDG